MTRPVLKGRPLPEYTHLGHEAHHKLRQSMETDGWPRVPRGLEQVEDFFEQSRDAVSERWTTHVQDLVNQSCGQWLKKIPENEETQDIRELLGNPQALEDAMRIRQFDALEGLRKFAPEAWWSLLMLSSERQRAAVTVAQHWNETMDEATFKKFGVTKAEISVLLDIASRVGTYIDQAYLKQIELADAPGGSTATPIGDQPGARHFYDAYNPKTGRVEIRTYRDVFHSAWEPMLNHFNDLANRVETLVQTKRLPKSYEPLAGYLRQMAETYGSAQTNPEALFDQWQQLLRRCQEIAEAGCPIMLMPQNCSAVTGDANKVDIELRLGLRTKQTNALEKQFEPLQARALQITGRYRAALDKQIETPKVLVNYQPFAFGASLYLNPLAENSDHMVITHTNAIEDLAAEDDIPLLKKMFGFNHLGTIGILPEFIFSIAFGSYAYIFAPLSKRLFIIVIVGESLTSSVPDLKASPRIAIFLFFMSVFFSSNSIIFNGCFLFMSMTVFINSTLHPTDFAFSISAETSFGKQEPPKPMPDSRKKGDILLS